MTPQKKYLLDSDTFIRAKNDHYRFSVCPGYWTALELQAESKRVASIAPVRHELSQQKDELSLWVKRRLPEFFFKQVSDQHVQRNYQQIVSWAQGLPRLTDAAKEAFALTADGWLVAYARANDFIVCTHEERRPESKTKLKLPDVADHFGVVCATPFDMLQELNVRFLLAKRKSPG